MIMIMSVKHRAQSFPSYVVFQLSTHFVDRMIPVIIWIHLNSPSSDPYFHHMEIL